MPRVVEVHVSWAGLILRLFEAVLFGGISLLLFYYLPTNTAQYVDQVVPLGARSTVAQIVSQIFTPSLAPIGLSLALLTAISMILRGGRVYGGLLVVIGALYLGYLYLLFHGGTLEIVVPAGLAPGILGDLVLDDIAIMLLFMIAPLLTMVKGVLLASASRASGNQS